MNWNLDPTKRQRIINRVLDGLEECLEGRGAGSKDSSARKINLEDQLHQGVRKGCKPIGVRRWFDVR